MGKDGRVGYGRERTKGYGTDGKDYVGMTGCAHGKGWESKVWTGKDGRVWY